MAPVERELRSHRAVTYLTPGEHRQLSERASAERLTVSQLLGRIASNWLRLAALPPMPSDGEEE